ncbi:MAG: hypothetical protein GXO85_02110 [Chlorobi bacterium]|nr:hypothetical protein [Chlorobiota bacterium]
MLQNSEKLIILGLTGPVGSGCTTFSKIFDDDEINPERKISKNELFKYLIKKKEYLEIDYDNKKIIINHDGIDEEIKTLFQKISQLDRKIGEIEEKQAEDEDKWLENMQVKSITPIRNDILQKNYYFELRRNLFDKLKNTLETRETLKALDELEPFIDYKKKTHHFRRISVSDFIIYRALIMKDEKKYGNNKNNEEKVSMFHSLISDKEISDTKREIEEKIQELLPQECHLRAIETLVTKDAEDDDLKKTIEILMKTLELIRKIKKKLKKDEKNLYRPLMQDFGDNIRKTKNPFDYETSFTKVSKVTNKVHLTLAKDIERLINFLYKNRNHSFFIIDSFRNPYEALYFKDKYPDFYLISLYAPVDEREKRLKRKDNFFDEKSDLRDQGKFIKETRHQFFMQNVPKTVKFSDIAINNDQDLYREKDQLFKDKLTEKIIRYLTLILDTGCTKPNDDEIMMNLAYTMAMKSNCISRQVGAVIVGKDGYVVGAGWNDVGEGKISCGLREIKDLKDKRLESYINILKNKEEDFSKGVIINSLIQKYQNSQLDSNVLERFCFCFKDTYSEKKLKEKIHKLELSDALDREMLIKELDIKRLEFCEALHAEENAIIQSSKIGGMGLKGGKIYTTSFPCELCAKKIQQVGIKEVIYTEPYPGNISEPIFLRNAFNKIIVRQFEGVMPHSYFKLFKVREDQKEWQKMYSEEFVD